MTTTGGARQAVVGALIVAAGFFARVAERQIREADHMGQREREQQDPGDGHVLHIAWPIRADR